MSGPIGILLPRDPDLETLRRARELAGLLLEASAANGTPRTVAIGLPDTPGKSWRRTELQLRDGQNGAVVRRLQWEPVPISHARRMFPNSIDNFDLDGIATVQVPRDWGWNFQDCDALIMLADTGLGAPLTFKPTAFYVPDLAMRVVPHAYASSIDDAYWDRQTDCFRIWRHAQIWTSDPDTVEDLVSYAGVRRNRIRVAPNLSDAEVPTTSAARSRQNRVAWLVKPSPLYDLAMAARAVEIYISEGGQLAPVLVGDSLGGFDPAAEDTALGALPRHSAEFLYSLPIEHVQSDAELVRFLNRSALAWSSRLVGGEGAAALLAGRCRLGLVGADYGINRHVVTTASVTAHLYRLGDPLAIVDALHEAEQAITTRQDTTFRPLSARAERVRQIQGLLDELLEPGREQ